MKVLGMGLPELMLVAIPLAISIVCCVVSAGQAEKKGYSQLAFGLLGFFLGVIGLIIALLLPSRKTSESASTADTLMKYKQLLDQGVITKEEFDQKKRELL